MTYKEALEYIENHTWQGSHLGLERTEELLEKLGNPHKKLRYVHVAGTNGKGSTAAMLASVLQKAGYVTGLNISPYLYRFNERIQVDGAAILDDEMAELTEQVRGAAEMMDAPPTEFEFATCLGFCYFLKKKCDIVVMEVGLGGRMDSTNVIESKEVAVITTIGLDHVAVLGDTLEAIAGEKAGIIKNGNYVVLSNQEESVVRTVRSICELRGARLFVADESEITLLESSKKGQNISWKHQKHLDLPLLGAHQRKNVSTVLETIEVLKMRGYEISDAAVQDGIRSTAWPGRFELLQENPTFIVDGGHNPQCAKTVADTLTELANNRNVIFLVGLLADKDVKGILDCVKDLAKQFVTVRPDSTRAMESETLKRIIKETYPHIPVVACSSIQSGVQTAKNLATEPEDIICAFGSLYMVGEIRNCFGLYEEA